MNAILDRKKPLLAAASVSVLALALFFSRAALSATNSPLDFFQTTWSPTAFSKTAIVGDETFYATVKSQAVAFADLPKPLLAMTSSYRYVAKNAVTGEAVVLNPLFNVKVEPFPLTKGGTYQTANDVPLRFPAGSLAGDYAISEELMSVAIVKPPAPTQPTAPTQPSAPTKPPAPTDSTASSGEPTKPPEPTAPTAPTRPSEPTDSPLPFNPPAPRGLGTVKYSPVPLSLPPAAELPPVAELPPAAESTPTTDDEPALAPKLALPANLALSSVTLSKSSATSSSALTGTVTLNGAAPTGGKVVKLSVSPNIYLTMPTSITVPAGKKVAPFGITVKSVVSPVTVVIKATMGTSWVSAPLKIGPITVALSVAPTAVTGGATSVGTVTLNVPAPAEAQTVLLTATPGTAITIPASVKLTGGMTRVNFNISTKTVKSLTNVTIRAVLKSSQGTAVLTVNPPKLSALTLSPATVINGATSVGTVTVSGPAPTGGLQVKLLVGSGFPLTLPASVTVKAGATSATFDIRTKKVPETVKVIVAAALNDVQKTAQLTIESTTITDFKLAPPTAFNGVPSVGTLTLNSAALADGLVVKLTATPANLATVPASVVVPVGANSVVFDIKPTIPPLQETVTITAALGNAKRTAVLMVGPSAMPTSCPYTCRAATIGSSSWGTPNWVTNCGSGEMPENRVRCPSVSRSYSCGVFGWRTCWTQVSALCCKPK